MDEALTSSCVCNISAQTQRAELIRQSNLIIWDELPMTHRYCVEALDRTLRDLTKHNQPFGGKTILFSGDWRQTGPIVKNGSPTDTVDAAFISSQLWNNVIRFKLTMSQRDKEDPQYASFVRSVGEGTHPTTDLPDESNLTALNNHDDPDATNHFQLRYTTDFNQLMHFVYPDLTQNSRAWNNRAILATTNHAIDRSNDTIAHDRPGEFCSFYSSDSLISGENSPNTPFASPEHLNQLNVQGVPPHELKLKEETLCLITRNLNFSESLVNGQKCVVLAVSPNSRVIQVELLTDENPRTIVLIPRIIFHGKVGRNGISFSRRQFPLKTAYSMTINKSQGQTLTKIGLDLRSTAFAHGQLFVALSRARNRDSIMCLLPESHIVDGTPYTDNIVYPPFIEAANGISDSPPPPHPPPHWAVQHEIGDGACGFRAIARRFLQDPDLHLQVRQNVVQHLSNHRNVHDYHIYDGIGTELMFSMAFPPSTYTSYDEYLTKMSMPTTFMGQPEILAAMQIYGHNIHVHFSNDTLPDPRQVTGNDLYLKFNVQAKHYDTFVLINADSSNCKLSPPLMCCRVLSYSSIGRRLQPFIIPIFTFMAASHRFQLAEYPPVYNVI